MSSLKVHINVNLENGGISDTYKHVRHLWHIYDTHFSHITFCRIEMCE